MTIEEELQAVRNVFIEYPQRYDELQKQLKEISEERQDLLHTLELGRLDAVQMTRIVKDLKDVQQRRRVIKDEIELLEEIKHFAVGKVKEKQVNRVIKRVQYINEKHATRSYSMRIRKDLQELVDSR